MQDQAHANQSSIAVDADADLTAVVSELADRVAELEQTVQEQQTTIDEQAQQIEEQAEQIEELEQTVEQTSNNASGAHARINSVEDELEDVNTDDNPHSRTPETGLEQLARLPDELLEDESANVQRSVALAESWRDHASKAPVGFVLSSGELARVLRDVTDCRGHSQTASRVIDRLDQLGGDGVSVVERRGERRVALEPELVGRLEELGESPTAANHDVVAEGTV
jgi:DNA repair exonuclease SbcCD ATPase subunit